MRARRTTAALAAGAMLAAGMTAGVAGSANAAATPSISGFHISTQPGWVGTETKQSEGFSFNQSSKVVRASLIWQINTDSYIPVEGSESATMHPPVKITGPNGFSRSFDFTYSPVQSHWPAGIKTCSTQVGNTYYSSGSGTPASHSGARQFLCASVTLPSHDYLQGAQRFTIQALDSADDPIGAAASTSFNVQAPKITRGIIPSRANYRHPINNRLILGWTAGPHEPGSAPSYSGIVEKIGNSWAINTTPVGHTIRWRKVGDASWQSMELTNSQAKAKIPKATEWNQDSWGIGITGGNGFNAILPTALAANTKYQIQISSRSSAGQGAWYNISGNTPIRIKTKAKLKFHPKYTAIGMGGKRFRAPAGVYATIVSNHRAANSTYYWKKPGSKKWSIVNYDFDLWDNGNASSHIAIKRAGTYYFKRVAVNKFGAAPASPVSKIKVTKAMLKRTARLGTKIPWEKYS